MATERAPTVARADERPHEPGVARDWEESWTLDFGRSDGLAGFVRTTLRPATGRCWYWAYLLRPGDGPVVVRDNDVAAPRGRTLALRADGLWADAVCETPLEHWSYGLEAFAVRLDHPTDARHGELGDRIPFGLDLEWEVGPAPPAPTPSGYVAGGTVHGEVLVGSEAVPFEGPGLHEHRWGPAGARPDVAGTLLDPDGTPAWYGDARWELELVEGLPTGGRVGVGAPGATSPWTVAVAGSVVVPRPAPDGGPGALIRAFVRAGPPASDGVDGPAASRGVTRGSATGWLEYDDPTG